MLPPSSLVGQHARMPLLILSMGVAEPLTARRAAHARRVGAFHSDSRDALTRPLQVRALVSLFSHRNDTPRATILRACRSAGTVKAVVRLAR